LAACRSAALACWCCAELLAIAADEAALFELLLDVIEDGDADMVACSSMESGGSLWAEGWFDM
jgi:hypothetical protein